MKLIVCVLAVTLLGYGAAAAQEPVGGSQPRKPSRPHRSGLWGEFGFGPGHARIACSGCEEVVGANGTTSYVRLGGIVSDHVLIGFEAFTLLNKSLGHASPDSGTTAETGTAAIIIMWYPGSRGLFFKGGVGAAFGQFSIPGDSAGTAVADTSEGGGIGITFGLGWDAPISRKFAFTGNAGVFVTALGDVALANRRVDDLIATMYSVSVGFTFR
ncbi:MAG TPA: hypothetical protein VJ755_10730 [Gemmatimonadales bacterium]|nr:hypothetical protein [Gemmatimonadales bacterium]